MPIPVGFGQVSYVFSGDAAGPGGCMVTLGLDVPSGVAPLDLASDYQDAFVQNIMPALSNDVTLTEVRLRISVAEGEVVQSLFGNFPGQDGSEASPPSVAWPVTKFSQFGGRANRGRWFLPGIPEDITEPSGAIQPAAITAFNEQLADYLEQMTSGDTGLVILHQSELAAPTPIVALLSGSLVFTRGSRLR